jgi:hypothetical protein
VKCVIEVRELADLVPLVAQDVGDARSNVRIVFDDEDVRRAQSSPTFLL